MSQPVSLTAAGAYTSQILATQDLGQKPVVARQLFRKFGFQFNFLLQFIREMGYEEPVAGDEWTCYLEQWKRQSFHSELDVTGQGTGQSVNIQLTAADLDSLNRFYPRVGYTVMFNDETQGYISAIDISNPAQPILTIDLVNKTKAIPSIAAGDEFMIGTQISGSGTNFPSSLTKGYDTMKFYAQIFKEKAKLEGGVISQDRWLTEYDNGDALRGYWNEAVMDAEYNLAFSEDNAYWFGDEFASLNTALTVPTGAEGAGNPMYSTKGMVKHIRTEGNPIPYTPGTLSMDFFYDQDTYLTGQGSTATEHLFVQGPKLFHEIEKLMVTSNYQTGADFVSAMQSAFKLSNSPEDVKLAEMEYSRNFKAVTVAGRRFLFLKYDIFSHPKSYGIAGYNKDTLGVVMPMGTVKDAVTKKSINQICSKYKSGNGLNRKYIVDIQAGTGANVSGARVVNEVDAANYLLFTNHGLQVTNANQMSVLDAS